MSSISRGVAPRDQIDEFAEREHAIRGGTERNPPQRGGGPIPQGAGPVGQTAKCIVVMHHGFAIGADLEIGFDAVIFRDGRHGGRRGILDDAARRIM